MAPHVVGLGWLLSEELPRHLDPAAHAEASGRALGRLSAPPLDKALGSGDGSDPTALCFVRKNPQSAAFCFCLVGMRGGSALSRGAVWRGGREEGEEQKPQHAFPRATQCRTWGGRLQEGFHSP